ncbi:EamA family transporter [Halobacillus kuroshimensis]|uniref:EamA family transporter n=1 Tax=Halobacillus kuroshimensis TaxID=302481 RepID=A0ABS3DS41_9BACI|nr:DMT family transporter [Halobacillus kuroshimensis]MBN8234154.1 EamA family transporter [Halobacillus kuroshimensis]
MKKKGALLVFIGAASFGFTPIFVKHGFAEGYSLGQLNIAQMIIAFVLLWLLSFPHWKDIRHMKYTDRLKVMGAGSSVGLTSIFYYGAMQYIPASMAIVLLFQFVWIGMLIEWVFLKKSPEKVHFVSLAITLSGVILASEVLSGGMGELPAAGVILGLLSALSYAAFIYTSGQAAPEVNSVLRSSWMITGSLLLVLIVFSRDIPTFPVLEGELWLISLGIAMVGAVIPPLFFAGGAPHISARLANILSSVELPVAIVSAMVVLKEQVTILQWTGIGLILFSIVVNETGDRWFGRSEKKKAAS